MKRLAILVFLLPVALVACSTGDATTSRTPKGNASATILVEEFGDLQCPACRGAHTQITAPILAKYGDKIRFEFKHFPLRSIHRYALDAAEMSECAADEGKFWEFLDKAYEKQDELSEDALVEWAKEIGVDGDKADACRKSHRKRGIVLADYEAGRARNVAGTPTYFVNGQQVQTGYDTLSAAIDAALSGPAMPL